MTQTIRTIVLAILCLLGGTAIGAWWPVQRAEAQASRFATERYGELLFIRYYNSVNRVECYVGMDGTGIIGVPCDRRDQESAGR